MSPAIDRQRSVVVKVSFGPDLPETRVSGNSLRRLVKQTRTGSLPKWYTCRGRKSAALPLVIARSCGYAARISPGPSSRAFARGVTRARWISHERSELHPSLCFCVFVAGRFEQRCNNCRLREDGMRSRGEYVIRIATRRSTRGREGGINFINYYIFAIANI